MSLSSHRPHRVVHTSSRRVLAVRAAVMAPVSQLQQSNRATRNTGRHAEGGRRFRLSAAAHDSVQQPAITSPSRRCLTAATLGLVLAPWGTPTAALARQVLTAGPDPAQLLADLARQVLTDEPSSLSSPLPSPTAPDSSTSGRIQQQYDGYAPTYDELDDGPLSDVLGFGDLRQQLLSRVQGDVLEVAVGTGLNLQFYDFTKVQHLTAIDLSDGMLQQARSRAGRQLPGSPIDFRQADATHLPLPDAAYDCVVDTFSLCVIPDPTAALREMARVVKPRGGRVLLLEHTRSDNPLLAAYQDVSADAVAATSKGCYWNQDIPALMRQAGLQPLLMTRHTAGTIVLIEAVRL